MECHVRVLLPLLTCSFFSFSMFLGMASTFFRGQKLVVFSFFLWDGFVQTVVQISVQIVDLLFFCSYFVLTFVCSTIVVTILCSNNLFTPLWKYDTLDLPPTQ